MSSRRKVLNFTCQICTSVYFGHSFKAHLSYLRRLDLIIELYQPYWARFGNLYFEVVFSHIIGFARQELFRLVSSHKGRDSIMDRICIAVLQKGLESTGMDLGVDCPKEVQRRSPKWFLQKPRVQIMLMHCTYGTLHLYFSWISWPKQIFVL